MELKAKQAAAAELMIEGLEDSEIAERLGLGRTTVWRWRHKPEVATVVAQARNRRMEENRRRLDELVIKAMDVFGELIADENTPPAIRLKAASEVLDRAGITAGSSLELDAKSRAQESAHAAALSGPLDGLMFADEPVV